MSCLILLLSSGGPGGTLVARTPDLLWKVDPARSSIRFHVHMLQKTVAGTFSRLHLESLSFSGYPRSLTGRLIVEIDSLQTDTPKRDAHLKSADFFWVDHYPNALIDLIGVTEDKGQTLADLLLEIRGIRRQYREPIQLKADWSAIQGKGKLVVRRRDFGLRGNILTNTIISDDVLIEYAIVLVRK